MDEREWRERYEPTQYDDEELDDTGPPVPPVPEEEELEYEDLPRPRKASWHRPVGYEFPSGSPSNASGAGAAG